MREDLSFIEGLAPQLEKWLPARRLPELIAGLLGLLLAGGVIAVFFIDQQPLPEEAPPRREAPVWFRGLSGLEKLHLTSYRENGLHWEIWSPLGNIRLERHVYGLLRARPLLHLVKPRALIHGEAGPLTIRARRVYFNPRESRWIFVQGALHSGTRSKEFEQLYWEPRRNRLVVPPKNKTHPLLRFWETIY